MTPEGKLRLDRVLQRQNLSRFVAEHTKPVFLSIMLSFKSAQQGGYDGKFGVDTHLATLAANAKVKVIGLETSQGQLAPFEELALSRQIKMLEEALIDIESGKNLKEGGRVSRVWETADQKQFDALADEINTDQSEMALFIREKLLVGRNQSLADKMAALLEQQDKVVVAVGAMHLIGKGSVPELLQAKGLMLERIY